MDQYIKKSAIMAEIRKYIKSAEAFLKYHHNRNDKSVYAFEQEKLVMCDLLYFLDTLEAKEVDLEKAIDDYIYTHDGRKRLALELDWKCCNLTLKGGDEIIKFAKHFFELGVRANNPITATDRGTAEEIIINLKRVEKDYRIDLTREIEWLRNKVKKGE